MARCQVRWAKGTWHSTAGQRPPLVWEDTHADGKAGRTAKLATFRRKGQVTEAAVTHACGSGRLSLRPRRDLPTSVTVGKE